MRERVRRRHRQGVEPEDAGVRVHLPRCGGRAGERALPAGRQGVRPVSHLQPDQHGGRVQPSGTGLSPYISFFGV